MADQNKKKHRKKIADNNFSKVILNAGLTDVRPATKPGLPGELNPTLRHKVAPRSRRGEIRGL